MSPIIRVDQEVYDWLTKLAKPFVDTPNMVLRRVARLDKHPSTDGRVESRASRKPMNSTLERVTGAGLNRDHRLGAKHALYHKDGTFYERLRYFPGVLCDPTGYVKFDSKEQFERDQHLSIGEKVNVHRTLSAHPRYRRFASG